jgi:hypothetical protein
MSSLRIQVTVLAPLKFSMAEERKNEWTRKNAAKKIPHLFLSPLSSSFFLPYRDTPGNLSSKVTRLPATGVEERPVCQMVSCFLYFGDIFSLNLLYLLEPIKNSFFKKYGNPGAVSLLDRSEDIFHNLSSSTGLLDKDDT